MNHPTPDFADRFPILQGMTLLNHAGVAPISGPAADALRTTADELSTQAPYLGVPWARRVNDAKRSAARLINARGEHEIAFVSNTSHGLALVARGIDWQPGDSVVITNVEYPANRYPWEDIARRHGVELIEVAQHPDGRIDVDDVCDAVNDRTRVVAISHVQYASGYRIDLKPIADWVHRLPYRPAYLCVDAIQSLGACPVDVRAMGIDFLAADGHKWMLGPEGCGIFYCHEDLAQQLHPLIIGALNMVDAQNYGDYRFELLPDARRFESGSANIPGIMALQASIDLLIEVGIDEVWRRIEALTARLCDRLTAIGCRIYSPRRHEAERSGIVVFDPPPGSPDVRQLVRKLAERRVYIVVREGRLRASPHFYNTPQQMDAVAEALAASAG
jgi:cysteine desulfurase/selenocysteine lyase